MKENVNKNLICSKCGTENIGNTNFCIKCGNKLQLSTVEEANMVLTKEDTNNGDVETSQELEKVQINKNNDLLASNNQELSYKNNMSLDDSAEVTPQVLVNNSLQGSNNNIDETQNNVDSVSPNHIVNNNFVQNNNVQYQNNINTPKVDNTAIGMNYIKYILGAVLKPFDVFKKNEENLGNFKNVGILSLIVVGFMTIVGLITTMINAVRVTSFWTDEVEWVWENLKEIEYFKVIGQSLLIYVGILFVISGIYFLASLVIKKEAKFPKLLGATVTAFIPFAIAASILSPLLSLIYSPLGICITIVGFIYTLVILLELLNELIKIENKNTRIYFHLTCLSVLVIGGGFVVYKLILGSLSSGLGGLSSLLG